MSTPGPNLGLMFSFRNPERWRRSFADAYRQELDLIAEADRLGFDTVWLTEHHFVDDGYSPSLVTLAAAIAARTERIRIGFNLIVLPLHNPINLAEDIATLDVLSNGRIDLGVGMGSHANEFEAFGIPMDQRLSRFKESLDILEGLLSNEFFSYEGTHYRVKNARLRPPAVQQPMPPLWIGGMAPPALRRAGERGAHWHGVAVPKLLKIYEDARVGAGYDGDTAQVSIMLWVHVADSDEQAWEEAAPHFHHVLTTYKASAAPGSPLFEASIPEESELRNRSREIPFAHVFGSPETVAERLRKTIGKSRITHFAINVLSTMDPAATRRSMRLLKERVALAL